jgi:hypothetical protein
MSKEIYKRRLRKEASLSISGSTGGTWRGGLLYQELSETGKRRFWERRASPYGSSARGTWKEGFFTGD